MSYSVLPLLFRDVLTVVSGGIPEATRLLALPWDMIFFTGSTTVGRIVASAAAKTLSPVILELGGKSPLIITEDMPELEAMADRIMWGKTINVGQTCVAPDYILCHEDNIDSVCEAFKKSLENMYGKGDEAIRASTFARNVSEKSTQRLIDLVKDAEKKGGEIIVGGHEGADVKEKVRLEDVVEDIVFVLFLFCF